MSFGSTGQHDVGAGPHGLCRTTGIGQHGGGSTTALWITGAGQPHGAGFGGAQPQPLLWFLSLACKDIDPKPHRMMASATAGSLHVVNLDTYIIPPIAVVFLNMSDGEYNIGNSCSYARKRMPVSLGL